MDILPCERFYVLTIATTNDITITSIALTQEHIAMLLKDAMTEMTRADRAYRFAEIEVTEQHGFGTDSRKPWPGPQRNVHYWVQLANGKAVGWNENPARGWSFPVVSV